MRECRIHNADIKTEVSLGLTAAEKKLCKNRDSTVDLPIFLVKWHCICEFKILQFA